MDGDRQGLLASATLFYQPQVTADGTRLAAVEALLRVRQPDGSVQGPGAVLSRIDTPEAAAALDWWALRRAATDAKRWNGLPVSVNISAAQFQREDFAPRLLALLEEVGTPPRSIELEVVETSVIEVFDRAVDTMNALRAAGIRIALDDFGTGYSSLSYLQKLPIDKLKLDRSMTGRLGDMRSAAIVQAVTALARALGLKVTAEGVETQEQQRFLRVSGCHFLQGYLFSPAVPPEEIDRLRQERWPLPYSGS